ncbi:uncharacterized protein LOC125668309 [Ostrea edulis]|uniref:uncharacterized protein LOC125668309 n=1 Tax=Ostrea edulis TaxID=37623 RepID=UPI0020963199|nr:uncharacterized protein LOC125668309 [Ostrea edulis]XP_048758236.1 uncharacterized protein LOC125668309 [Ostrea edulis]XP_056020198.1 uncharacterized protein LOC125668309 [Ostrea edulis]XP_056020199.1 uncharacterized protein LOC125668309 [Ostrea edulis]
MSGPPTESSPLTNLPSVVASKILSYVPWQEKKAVGQVITSWTEALRSTEAWRSVKYGPEIEENVYFARASRADFLTCVKQYGHFMRSIHLCFGYSITHTSMEPTGEQILMYVHKRCCNLTAISIEQEVPEGSHNALPFGWPSSVGNLIKDIAVDCKSLQSLALCQPIVVWDEESENILLLLTKSCSVSKITELELTYLSLLNQEGKLHLLKNFTSLQKLTVRREKVNKEILLHLVKHSLKELVLYQEEELPFEEQEDLGEDFWLEVKKVCPQFKVDLILRCIMILKILFPSSMPVRNLILDFLVNVMTKGIMDHIADCYRDTLKRFTYTNSFLEEQEMGDARVPASLISLTQKCPHLETLEYGFPLSSSAILLIAQSRKLKNFVVPSVEVSYSNDIPVDNSTPKAAEYFNLLKIIGSSRRNLEKTVSHILEQQWTLHDGPLKVNERIKF